MQIFVSHLILGILPIMKRLSPGALYRAEKERVTRERTSTHARLLAEAKAAFEKLIAEGQAARKGGRPKGSITLGSPKRAQPVEPVHVMAPPAAKVAVAKKAVPPAKAPAAARPAEAKKVKSAATPPKKKAPAKSRKPARTVKKKPAPAKKKPAARKPAKKK